MTQEIPVVFLDDRLGRGSCACLSTCRELVETLRLGTGRYRRMRRAYIATTPSELLDLPQEVIRERRHSLAVLDLEAYADIDAAMEAARTRTEKRGRVNRDVSRAQRLGYYAKPFAFEQHIPDIVEIHQSKDERQGKPLNAYARKTVEELGGAPTRPFNLEPPLCQEHHWSWWGVFLPREGHVQGAVRTDEQLVGYIRMRRQGNSASYTAIMGHGEHLANGIMYLLHFHIVEAMMRTPPAIRPRYLVYLNYDPQSTLGEWKRRALFDPRYLHYADERTIDLPGSEAPPRDQSERALDVSLQYPWSQARAIAETFDISLPWLTLLQRAWMIDQTRGPGAVKAILEHGPDTIEALQWFRSDLFPLHILDRKGAVSVALSGNDRGVDTLLPLRNAKVEHVDVYHTQPTMLDHLQKCYGPGWTYNLWTKETVFPATSKSAIIEGTRTAQIADVAQMLGAFSGTVILSADERMLTRLGFAMENFSALYEKDAAAKRQIGQTLGNEFGRAVAYQETHYRYADPGDVFWLCFNLA